MRLAKTSSDMKTGRIAVDFAGRPDLQQPSSGNNTDPIRHRHGFDLVVGYIEQRRAELLLDPLEFQAKFRA